MVALCLVLRSFLPLFKTLTFSWWWGSGWTDWLIDGLINDIDNVDDEIDGDGGVHNNKHNWKIYLNCNARNVWLLLYSNIDDGNGYDSGDECDLTTCISIRGQVDWFFHSLIPQNIIFSSANHKIKQTNWNLIVMVMFHLSLSLW